MVFASDVRNWDHYDVRLMVRKTTASNKSKSDWFYSDDALLPHFSDLEHFVEGSQMPSKMCN